ncbi:Hypothetical_protein [Hexamita inflata]|uniref:Hypothetical_protein n=1 Tax=Hexamita inflata TaxID=28002 RepID=A0AA86PUF8_9EUKA|nr:Hypothetical protein HINF_LOCUS34084 [Hexamita inflata]CAI9946441.1 Hypothetical protein HINF_LOCUS34086 [Hexamita inflata]CAI9973193.1 Hypothetical protein HINF_LOCUS60838 [Hexamita inflata]CAI9973195.1 Hypothetical protein HINF_LOCUS60840 [Hexamita inflata]CAI9973197.1 Hypothetical protein HINF_LOCUS60842 [Hexamita inflata]
MKTSSSNKILIPKILQQIWNEDKFMLTPMYELKRHTKKTCKQVVKPECNFSQDSYSSRGDFEVDGSLLASMVKQQLENVRELDKIFGEVAEKYDEVAEQCQNLALNLSIMKSICK